jgi:hypothetical protein
MAEFRKAAIFKQPSYSVSEQTTGTCYAHVIARIMRRLLYTFYQIPSETRIRDFYHQGNMNVSKYFVISKQRHYANIYYEHFSALVYLYFFELAININRGFIAPGGENDGGSVYEVLFNMWPYDVGNYRTFLSIIKAEEYHDEPFLRAVHAFIYAAYEDPEFELQIFRDYSTKKYVINTLDMKLADDQLLEFDTDKDSLSSMTYHEKIVMLCDYALENGYMCMFLCINVETGRGHVVIIVEKIVEERTGSISYKIKNSWGSECVDDVEFMNIRNGWVKLDDLSNKNCGLIFPLPTIVEPCKDKCQLMHSIVYGEIDIGDFKTQMTSVLDFGDNSEFVSNFFNEEEEIISTPETGRSLSRLSSKSSDRKSRSPGRKARSPSRKARRIRSWSRGGKKAGGKTPHL